MEFNVTLDSIGVHPARFVRADLHTLRPVASGLPGVRLLAVRTRLMSGRGAEVEQVSADAFLVAPSNDPAVVARETQGSERRVTVLLRVVDAPRHVPGDRLDIWVPLTVCKDVFGGA